MKKRCKGYVGLACVDGTCPRIDRDENYEYCVPLIRSCRECGLYRGCEDCALKGTEHCEETV